MANGAFGDAARIACIAVRTSPRRRNSLAPAATVRTRASRRSALSALAGIRFFRMSAASASSSSLAGTPRSTGSDELSPVTGAGVVAPGATAPGDGEISGDGAAAASDGSAVVPAGGAADDGGRVSSLGVAGGAPCGIVATTTGLDAPERAGGAGVGDGNATSLADGKGMLTVVAGSSDLPIDSHNAAIAATTRPPVASAAMAVWRRRGRIRTGAASFDASSPAGAGSGGVSARGPGAVSPADGAVGS